ncbi:MAG: hypothetical protein AAGU27_14045 [Dehalobacterium sp.]
MGLHETPEKRVGLILPSVNVMMEPEFNRIVPRHINFYAVRVLLTETTPEALVEMEKDLERQALLISSVKPIAVAYACTSGSFIQGVEWDEEIKKKIQSITGCPAVTTSSAMLQAIKALGISKLGVVTPYIDRINVEEKKFFETNGIEVTDIKGLQITDAEILHSQTPETFCEMIRKMDCPEINGFFISCTDVRGLEIVEQLEEELGKPVTTSSQATLWAILKMIDHHEPINGYGKLLRELL